MKRRDDLAAFVQIPNFAFPTPSTKSDHVAVIKKRADDASLEIHDLTTGTFRSVADAAKRRPCWVPSGDQLYFLTEKANAPAIWRTDLSGDTHEVVQLEDDAGLEQVDGIGRYLYFTLGEELRRYDEREDVEETILSDGPYVPGSPIQSVFLSPDGSELAYTIDVDGSSETFHPTGRPCIARSDGSQSRPLEVDTDPIPGASDGLVVRGWHPDYRCLLLASHPFAGHCGVYDLEADRVDWHGLDLDTDGVPFPGLELPLSFLPDGSGFVAWRLAGTSKRLVVYDLDGESTAFHLDGEIDRRVNPEPRFLDDEQLLLVRERETEPGDVISIDVDSGEIEPLIAPGYGAVNSDRIVTPEFVEYAVADGRHAPGVLYRPDDPNGAGLLEVYSGYSPAADWPRTFRPEMQYLAASGVTVLQAVNPADPFTDAAHANYAAAGAWLAELPWVERDRIGVLGFSLGGYDALMQAFRHAEVWTVCICGDGFPDLFAADQEVGGMPTIRDTLGDPEENASVWRRQNPMDELERNSGDKNVPLLLWRTGDRPAKSFEQLYDRMRGVGWDAGENLQYVTFDTQGHVELSCEGRLQRWATITEFVFSYLAS